MKPKVTLEDVQMWQGQFLSKKQLPSADELLTVFNPVKLLQEAWDNSMANAPNRKFLYLCKVQKIIDREFERAMRKVFRAKDKNRRPLFTTCLETQYVRYHDGSDLDKVMIVKIYFAVHSMKKNSTARGMYKCMVNFQGLLNPNGQEEAVELGELSLGEKC